MAPTTRAMRKIVLDRDILQIFKKRLLSEVQAESCRYRATRYAAVKKVRFHAGWRAGVRRLAGRHSSLSDIHRGSLVLGSLGRHGPAYKPAKGREPFFGQFVELKTDPFLRKFAS